MKKENNMNVIFLLDRSGSMSNIVSDTIGGYNNYLDSLKGKNIKITTILFDNKREVIVNNQDINKVKYLDNKTYYVRGSTALLDAIGYSIEKTNKNKKYLFVITTDGYENASVKYNKEMIKEMINGHKNIEFIYIGADIDTYSEASSIGISKNNIASYKKSRSGVNKMFSAVSAATESMYLNDSLDSNWSKELD